MKHLLFFSFLSALILNSNIYAQDPIIVVLKGISYKVNMENETASIIVAESNIYMSDLYDDALESNVIIPDKIIYKRKEYKVTLIENYAFKDCNEIQSLHIPSSVSRIDPFALIGVPKLVNITVDPQNNHYQSDQGILFNKDLTILFRFPPKNEITSYSIPSTVHMISDFAFSNCKNIKSITIPTSVTTINSYAFEGCIFKEIILPQGITKIGDFSFTHCSNLITIRIPFSLTELGKNAFSHCSRLKTLIYLNKNLSLPENAFEGSGKVSLEFEISKEQLILSAIQGNTEDQYNLGMCYFNGNIFTKDIPKAVEWLTKAGDGNHVKSQKLLGDIYSSEVYGLKNDQKAYAWLMKAASNGDHQAQVSIGNYFFEGRIVDQSISKAVEFYLYASKAGNNEAAYNLGEIYYSGYGDIKRDYLEAFKWYKLSAENGNPKAAYMLGNCYYQGQGTIKNNSESLKWTELAFNSGVDKAKGLFCILSYKDGQNKMNSKDYNQAINRFTSVIEIEDNNIDAYINRGYCYLNLPIKKYELAEQDFQKGLVLDPNNEIAKSNMAIITKTYQKKNEAKVLYETGDMYYKQTKYKEAVTYYSKSLSVDNKNPYVYYSIGYCFFDCELNQDANKFFNMALEVDPEYSDAKKAIKRANALIILNALSESLEILSANMNDAYNSSYDESNNFESSPVYYPTTPTVNNTPTLKRKTCSYCNGTGRVSDYVATFGQTGTKWCEHCKRDVPLSHCCQCNMCPSCFGKTYIESY